MVSTETDRPSWSHKGTAVSIHSEIFEIGKKNHQNTRRQGQTPEHKGLREGVQLQFAQHNMSATTLLSKMRWHNRCEALQVEPKTMVRAA